MSGCSNLLGHGRLVRFFEEKYGTNLQKRRERGLQRHEGDDVRELLTQSAKHCENYSLIGDGLINIGGGINQHLQFVTIFHHRRFTLEGVAELGLEMKSTTLFGVAKKVFNDVPSRLR